MDSAYELQVQFLKDIGEVEPAHKPWVDYVFQITGQLRAKMLDKLNRRLIITLYSALKSTG
jgi:hypothetical protein